MRCVKQEQTWTTRLRICPEKSAAWNGIWLSSECIIASFLDRQSADGSARAARCFRADPGRASLRSQLCHLRQASLPLYAICLRLGANWRSGGGSKGPDWLACDAKFYRGSTDLGRCHGRQARMMTAKMPMKRAKTHHIAGSYPFFFAREPDHAIMPMV